MDDRESPSIVIFGDILSPNSDEFLDQINKSSPNFAMYELFYTYCPTQYLLLHSPGNCFNRHSFILTDLVHTPPLCMEFDFKTRVGVNIATSPLPAQI